MDALKRKIEKVKTKRGQGQQAQHTWNASASTIKFCLVLRWNYFLAFRNNMHCLAYKEEKKKKFWLNQSNRRNCYTLFRSRKFSRYCREIEGPNCERPYDDCERAWDDKMLYWLRKLIAQGTLYMRLCPYFYSRLLLQRVHHYLRFLITSVLALISGFCFHNCLLLG